MTTITIPKKIIKDDLVIIPRKDYEKLLVALQRYTRLDEDLGKALKQVKRGRTIGPFNSVKELRHSLEGK